MEAISRFAIKNLCILILIQYCDKYEEGPQNKKLY